jgi:methyl-accepting chemotaxis protein
MPRLSIRTKLIGSYALIVAVMAVLTVVAISQLNASGDRTDRFASQTLPKSDLVSGLIGPMAQYRMMQYARIVNADLGPKVTKPVDKILDQYKADVAKGFTAYEPFVADQAERTYLSQLKSQWQTYLDLTAPALQAADTDQQQALSIMENQAKGGAVPAFVAMQTLLGKWQKDLVTDANRQADDARGSTSDARLLILILLGAAILLAAAVAFFISRGITRSVRDVLTTLRQLRDHCSTLLRGGLEAVASGDLTKDIEPTTPPIERIAKDELGDVAQAVNEIRANTVSSVEAYNDTRASLSQMIGEVQSTAGQVAAASHEVAETSEETGRAVNEIATAVGEVAKGAEDQVRMIDTARQSAEETSRAADEARTVAEDGANAAVQATEAMGAVRDATTEASGAIRALAAKSDEIGGIVETIGGIAEQTNLLALNAAIEAARAGEQGRGFAVVAEEVRKLAEESQQAAAAIGGLIEQVQAETERAVHVVEQGATRSDEGAEIVDQARASFERIAAAVRDMGGRINEIATATTEVASVAEESSASTEQVSASTQETSASTQQIAASAQELSRSAEELERMVSRFSLAAT